MSADAGAVRHAPSVGASTRPERVARPAPSRITSASVWQELAKQSFGVLSHVNAAGEPRSSGVVYGLVGHRLFIAVARDSWKARQLATGDWVSMTVPVRRGGILSLLFPIPPATISFHARVTVHAPGAGDIGFASEKLEALVPEARRAESTILEIVPEGAFLTYGISVSLRQLADPVAARAHVAIA